MNRIESVGRDRGSIIVGQAHRLPTLGSAAEAGALQIFFHPGADAIDGVLDVLDRVGDAKA